MAELQKKRRWRFGDRPDGYLVRTIAPLMKFTPFIMPKRCDACNTYADQFDVTKTDKYCREKVKAGMTNFTVLHVILAAYVRMLATRPGANRFVSGQRIFHRHKIEVVMAIKRSMSLNAEETCVKVEFDPHDTAAEIYEKFNAVAEQVQSKPESNAAFEKVCRGFSSLPRFIFRGLMGALNFMDYYGFMPAPLLKVSPFHGSMIITSMGSLGIRPIYHHIYNFGNLPVFLAYGGRRTEVCCDENGKAYTKKVVELKAVTDERICDGYYYASAFKLVKRYVENPEILDEKPEEVLDDID